MLRYFRGQDSTAIGKALGIPSGTVRWRLKRALEELRTELDRRFEGGRGAWGAFLGSLLAPVTAPQPLLRGTEAGLATSAPIALPLAWKTAGVLLLAAGGVTAWNLVSSPSSTGQPAEQSLSSAGLAAPASAVSEEFALAGADSNRTPVLVTESERQDPMTTAPEDGIEFCGVILVDGRPPEWPIQLTMRSWRYFHGRRAGALPSNRTYVVQPPTKLLPGEHETRMVLPEQGGAFSFGVLPTTWSGSVTAEGCEFENGKEWKDFAAPAGGLVLRLRSPPAITGRVLDSQGLPVPSAEYGCQLSVESQTGAKIQAFGPCDARGHFRIPLTVGSSDPDATVEGRLLVEAPDLGRRVLDVRRFLRTQGADLGDIELEPSRSVSFRLLDPSGSPIQGGAARLEDPDFSSETEATDDDGVSVLVCVPVGGSRVRFGALRYGDRVLIVSPGDPVEVTLEPTASLEIQLVAAEGSVLPPTKVIVRAEQRMFVGDQPLHPELMFPGSELKSRKFRGSKENPSITLIYEPDEDGRILLTGLLPGVPFQIEVRDSKDRTLALRGGAVGAQEWQRLAIPIFP